MACPAADRKTDHLHVTCSKHATVGRSRDHHATFIGVIQMIDIMQRARVKRLITRTQTSDSAVTL